MSTQSPAIKGGCRCGAISFTSTSTTLPIYVVNCHCMTCRKLANAPYMVWAEIATPDLTWEDSSPSSLRISKYSEVAERGLCSACGSPLWMRYLGAPELTAIAVGAVDEDSAIGMQAFSPAGHIFLEEKAGWFVLPEDGLARHQTFSKAFQKELEEGTKMNLK